MRGAFQDQGEMFSYVSLEERVPAHHPLRKIREYVRAVLVDMDRTFARMYAQEGRPSIPPEQLLSALLLQVFYSVRSERQLMEQMDYNLLFRWFVGLSPDAPAWDATTFTKNRERLQESDVFERFMTALLRHPKVEPLLSDEHFSVDGTLIEAWASHKSFKKKDGSGDDEGGANFHGEKRSNKTQANGTAERTASEKMMKAKAKEKGYRLTVGEDKAYDTADHVAALRKLGVTPHVAQNDFTTKTGKTRKSAIDERTTRHDGYGMSQTRRKMIECIFGWGKQHGTMRKAKHRGIARVAGDFLLNLIAYNLIRIPKLAPA